MRLIILFLLLSLGGQAQIIRAQPFYVPLGCSGLLLDCYPNAAAAYSLRKLKSSYTGSAIKVRRSSDNTTQDIGFTSNGDLDTASMKTFVGANNGFIDTWYNQGDSTSVNFTQSTAASQPRIISSGTIERRSGKPTIRFDNSGTIDFMSVASSTVKFNYLHQSGQAAIFGIFQPGVNNTNPNIGYFILDNINASGANVGYNLFWDDRSSVPRNNFIESTVSRGVSGAVTSSIGVNNYFAADTMALLTQLINNSTSTASDRSIIYRNGSNEQKPNTFTNTASTANASFNLFIGRFSGGTTNSLNGYITEFIFYSTNQSSNRTGIETNINNYYGLW